MVDNKYTYSVAVRQMEMMIITWTLLQCRLNVTLQCVQNSCQYSSLVAYYALLCFQDGPIGVQVSTK